MAALTGFQAVFAAETNSDAVDKDTQDIVNIMRVGLVPPHTLNYVEAKLREPMPGAPRGLSYAAVDIPLGNPGELNPLGTAPIDFRTGNHLVLPGEKAGPPPVIPAKDLTWFDDIVKKGNLPEIFIIGGHDVIPEGWHDNAERHHIYLPSLMQAIRNNSNAKKVFDHVKFAILGGCNTLTDLEPHGPHGEYLEQGDIERIYKASQNGRSQVVGAADETNSLEFYKARLAREYGPSSPEYAYTRVEENERCLGPGKYDACKVENLERTMPESGLYDGSHRYNRSKLTKEIFPNAYLVLGFNSASPSEDVRAQILSETIRKSQLELSSRNLAMGNPIQVIVSDKTPEDIRKRVIEVVRKNWTLTTYQLNRSRPSGSITPAYPDIDESTPFPTEARPPVSNGAQVYGQYEQSPTMPLP